MPRVGFSGGGGFDPTLITQNLLPTSANGANIGSAAFPFGTVEASHFYSAANALTAGTMNADITYAIRYATSSFTWTNAMVVALGAGLVGDITVCTLPAKTIVVNAYLVVSTAAAGVTTLTGALGRVAAGYIDYIVASDLKAAANTVYGDASAERGTNLTGYDLPSYTATTVVKVHFISTVQNLDQTATCTGKVILFTALLS